METFVNLLESEYCQARLQELKRWVRATRQNHALEHATLQLLAERGALTEGAGVSDPGGFTLLGDMNLPDTERAVTDALAALQDGQSHLAIHPQCGSNLMAQAGLCLIVGLTCFGSRRKRDIAKSDSRSVWLCGCYRGGKDSGSIPAALHNFIRCNGP